MAALKPITAVVLAYVQFREIIAALVIITICFIAGLIVRTGPGLRAKKAFEGAVLERLPGYTLLRGLAGRFTGRGDESTFAPALVEIEEALVPALISKNSMMGRLRCCCHRCRHQWREHSTSCHPSVCILWMSPSPRRSRCSRSGEPVLASLFGRCSQEAFRQLRRKSASRPRRSTIVLCS